MENTKTMIQNRDDAKIDERIGLKAKMDTRHLSIISLL